MKEDRDERTIKEIIEYLKKQNGNCSNELSNVEGLCLVNYIEWLEKEKDRLGKLFYERNEENIKLNNIINELERYIGNEYYCFDNESLEFKIAKDILDKLQELKGSNEPSLEEMVGFVENVYKDIKSQSTLHEELEEERKTIAKIVGDFKEVIKSD